VAVIAQQAGVNANLLFNWRRLHLQAQPPNTCHNEPAVLLPVTAVAAEDPVAACVPTPSGLPPRTAPFGTIEIDINGARVRLRGEIAGFAVRAAQDKRALSLRAGGNTRAIFVVAGQAL
jgi:transposase